MYSVGSQWEVNGVKSVFLHYPECLLSLICERKDKDAVTKYLGGKCRIRFENKDKSERNTPI